MTLSDAAALPLSADVDVLVAGGGPAGVCAALAAARAGASTLVAEQFNCLGGVACSGGHGHISIFNANGTDTRVVGGIPYEIAARLYSGEHAARMEPIGIWFEVEKLKFLLEKMAQESNVRLLYHTFLCEAVMDGDRITGAVIQNKDGRSWIRAKRVIDCTGDADIAASAGAPFEVGRDGDGHCQPLTLMFTVGGVDWETVRRCRPSYDMRETWTLAQRNGDMEPFQSKIMGFWWTPTRPDQVCVNFTHVTGRSGTSAEDLTFATIEARRQAFQMIDVFRKYVKGMESCYMVSTPASVGVRETRRIAGDTVLTELDIRAEREWPDSIGYGAFFIDIHNIDGPGMDRDEWHPAKGFHYQIPYSIMLPGKVDGLLVAGRCASVTHVALGSVRVMAQCGVMGEAAGLATALSLEGDRMPRSIDIAKLQSRLRANGAIIDETDIRRINSSWPWAFPRDAKRQG